MRACLPWSGSSELFRDRLHGTPCNGRCTDSFLGCDAPPSDETRRAPDRKAKSNYRALCIGGAKIGSVEWIFATVVVTPGQENWSIVAWPRVSAGSQSPPDRSAPEVPSGPLVSGMKFHRRNVVRRVSGILRTLARNPSPSPARSGWPELSLVPLLRRRKTDASSWHSGDRPDDWKR